MARKGVGSTKRHKVLTTKNQAEKKLTGNARARDKAIKDVGLGGDLAESERCHDAQNEKGKSGLDHGRKIGTRRNVAKGCEMVGGKAKGEQSMEKESSKKVGGRTGRGRNAGKREAVPEKDNAEKARTPGKRGNVDMELAGSIVKSIEKSSYSLRERRGVPSFRKVDLSESSFDQIVGKRVKVYSSGSGKWFTGKIESYDSKKKCHRISYDDGGMEVMDLKTRRFELEVLPGEAFNLSSKCKPNIGKKEMDVDNGVANAKSVREGSLKVGDNASLKVYSRPMKKRAAKTTKAGIAEAARTPVKRSRNPDMEIVDSIMSSSKRGSYSLRARRVAPSFKKVNLSESDFDQVVGKRVKIYLSRSKKWYTGRIEAYDGKKKRHKVLYDDGDVEELDLKPLKFELEVMPGEAFTLHSKHKPSSEKEEIDLGRTLASMKRVKEDSFQVSDGTLKSNSKPTRKVVAKAAEEKNAENIKTRKTKNIGGDFSESFESSTLRGPYSLRKRRRVPSFKKVNLSESGFDQVVGKRVKLHRSGSRKWFTGRIESYDSKEKHHKVLYDDGKMEELDLKTRSFELEVMPGEAFIQSSVNEPDAGKKDIEMVNRLVNLKGVKEGNDEVVNKYSKPRGRVARKSVKPGSKLKKRDNTADEKMQEPSPEVEDIQLVEKGSKLKKKMTTKIAKRR